MGFRHIKSKKGKKDLDEYKMVTFGRGETFRNVNALTGGGRLSDASTAVIRNIGPLRIAGMRTKRKTCSCVVNGTFPAHPTLLEKDGVKR